MPADRINVVCGVDGEFHLSLEPLHSVERPVNDLHLSWALVSANQVVIACLAHLRVRQARISHQPKIPLSLSPRPTHLTPRETSMSRSEMVTITIAATPAHLMILASTQVLIPYLCKIKTTDRVLRRRSDGLYSLALPILAHITNGRHWMALMAMWIATGIYLPVRNHTRHRILPSNDNHSRSHLWLSPRRHRCAQGSTRTRGTLPADSCQHGS